MVMGHYATALIPYAYDSNRKLAPFWFFLLATQALLHHGDAGTPRRGDDRAQGNI